MKIFNSIADFTSKKGTIVTIGTFDGVHIGHKKILEKITQNISNGDCESLVLTFFPHPRAVLQSDSEMKQLNTIDEKISLMEKAGVNNLVIHPFDKEFSRLTAEEFVKQVLVDTFKVQKIVIGYDHRFGRNRTADINDLIEFGHIYNFEVEQISAEELNEVAVSSTKIRNALVEGDIELANSFLGYNYSMNGLVVKGKQLGRTIGFPTANINVEEDYKLVPSSGVYVVKCNVGDESYFGMMNIGTNPTVENTNETQKIEVNIFNFEKEIYGEIITVSFLKRIRSEQKFTSLNLLKTQIENDKLSSLNFIESLS